MSEVRDQLTPLNRKLARNAFFLLISQVALSALSLILTAVLGRWLGVMEFGVYYLLASLSMLYTCSWIGARVPT